MGRFFVEKNHADLIAAFSEVAADFPGWTLRLAGDGALRADLERQVSELGIGPNVQFAGTVRDIASEYAAADIVAVPSLRGRASRCRSAARLGCGVLRRRAV